MNPAAKRGWLARLRSGHFRKGTQTLYHPTRKTYCCLGVLAKDPACPITNKQFHNYLELESPQLDWAGISRQLQGVLIRINDTARVNFNFIADIIEEYL